MHTPPALTNSPPQCLACDYWLVGLAEHRCPECGRAFDPADPTSYRTRVEQDDLYRLALAPPSSRLNGVAAIAAYALLLAASVPGTDLFSAFWASLVGAGCAAMWAIRLLMHFAARRYFHRRSVELPRLDRSWAVIPILVLVTLLLVVNNVPLQFRVLLSRPAMDRYAREALKRGTPWPDEEWIGLFPARRIHCWPTMVEFAVAGSGWFGAVARLAYVPSTSAPPSGWNHLQGNWYIWTPQSLSGYPPMFFDSFR